MLFNSLPFILFLPIVFLGYWFIGSKLKNLFLLLASYYFYFSYNPWFLLLLIGTSALDYFLAKKIHATQNQTARKLLLIFSIISNIGVLFIFKYLIFFCNTALSLYSDSNNLLSQFIIPAGLSFYTFQSISYTIDVYRKKYNADDSLLNFLLYVSFFPHMVAGPIVKYDCLMPQLKTRHFLKDIELKNGIKLIVWGYFKKMVIADTIGDLINPIFTNLPSDFNSIEYITVGVLFLIQLYADFSGYSDIAIGVAKLFKINLSINWKRPLLATSITEYWKRHHISLTKWFKDYVYISLGGNKVKTPRWILNITLVFLLSGLWHGANFTFIIWGALNCLFYLLEHLTFKIPVKIPTLLKSFYTMFFISIFFIAFRANSVSDLIHIYKVIFLEFNFHQHFNHLFIMQDKLVFMILFLMISILLVKEIQEEFVFIKPTLHYKKTLTPIFYLMILFLVFAFGNFNANTFIYFQF